MSDLETEDTTLAAPGGESDAQESPEQAEPEQPDLQDVYQSVADADPNHAAEVLKISQQTGQHPEVVNENLPEFKRAMYAPTREQFPEIKTRHPVIGKFLSDPVNMAVAYDDHKNLTDTSGLVQRASQWFATKAAHFSKSVLEQERVESHYDELMGNKTGDMNNPIMSLMKFRPTSLLAPVFGIRGSDPAERTKQIDSTMESIDRAYPPEHSIADSMVTALPMLSNMLAAGAAGTAAGTAAGAAAGVEGGPLAFLTGAAGGAIGGKLATADFFYKQGYVGTHDRLSAMRDDDGKPIDPENIRIAATINGAAQAGLSAVELAKILPKGTPAALLKTISKGGAATDALKEFLGNSVHAGLAMAGFKAADIATDEGVKAVENASGGKFHHEALTQALGDALSAGVEGAVTFAPMSALGPIMGLRGALHDVEQAHETKQNLTAFMDLRDKSKLNGRMPDLYQKVNGDLTRDTPLENVHVDREAAERLFQKDNVDPAAQFKAMGLEQEYALSKQTGEPMKIPTAKWLSDDVPAQLPRQLLDDTKLDPSHMTVNEIKKVAAESSEKMAAQKKLVQEQGEFAAQEIAKSPDTKIAHEGIAADARQRLEANVPVDMLLKDREKWLNENAKMVANHYVSEASRRGVDAGNLYATEFPKITGAGAPESPDAVSQEPVPDAKFIGVQRFPELPDEPPIPLYNITKPGHERINSTVTAETLKGLGLKVPEVDEKLLQAASLVPTFYSKMQKDIEAKLPEKATVEQARALLRDAKEDERKWSGVDDFLDKQKDGKVSKQELLDHLRANQLKIDEIEKGDKRQLPGMGFDSAEEVARSAETLTKYSDYQLPGGQNYRELLLKMPPLHDVVEKSPQGTPLRYDKQEFRSSHFDEPNILAHVRFNDRVDSEGKRILFLEEVQSDWHQKGRREGYKEPVVEQKVSDGKFGQDEHQYFVDMPDGKRRAVGKGVVSSEVEAKKYLQRLLVTEGVEAGNRNIDRVPDAPLKKTWHEFALKRMLRYAAENGYDKLGWTTGDQQAARYDLSKQVDEVRAEKRVNSDDYHVYAIGKDGQPVEIGDHPAARLPDVVGKDLADKIISHKFEPLTEVEKERMKFLRANVDKMGVRDDSAQNELDVLNRTNNGVASFAGVDLKVGGEGMKGFYDKIVPSFLNKFGKKFGAEVGETSVETPPHPDNALLAQLEQPGFSDAEKQKVHALPITPELKRAALTEGFPLFQGNAQGEYVPSLNEIRLNKNSNASTFMHEFMHGALQHMFDFSRSGQATQEYLDHFKAMSDFLGIQDDQAKLTTEQHEKAARGFERYLRGEDSQTGATKAPTPELQSAFNMFRRWLTNVYRQVKASPLEGELTPEVRGFFDRMLATDDALQKSAQEAGYKPGEIESIPDADPAQQARHRTLQERAREQAENELLKEQMAEMREEHRAMLGKERERLTKRIEPAVADHPLYAASQDVEENRPGPRKNAATLADEFLNGKLSPQEQGAFESAAEVRSFADGRDLAESIKADAEAGGQAAAVKSRVDQEMLPFADMKNTDAIRTAALKAIHDHKMTELLALEQEILSGMQHNQEVRGEVAKRNRLSAKIAADAAREQAKAYLESRPLKEAASSREFITAERNAAVRVSKALAAEDYAKAAEAKRQQMLNHALAAVAMKNSDEIARKSRFLDKFIKRGNDLMNMPYGFVTKIDDMLVQHGLMDPRDPAKQDTLAKNAQDMAEKGSSAGDIANATGLVQDATGKWARETLPDFMARVNEDYYPASLPDSVMGAQGEGLKQVNRNMTLAQLRDLNEAVKIINSIGKGFERYMSAFVKGDIRESAAAFKAQVEKNIGTPHGNVPPLGELDMNKLEKAVAAIKSVPDSFITDKVNLLTVCEYMDRLAPDGEAKKNIYRPLRGAENDEIGRKADAASRLEAIREKHYTKDEIAKLGDQSFATWEMQTPDGVKKVRLTKENALVLLLNRGSESNLDRITRGFNKTHEEIRSITDGLDKRDHEFAQDIWKFVDSFWPEASALEMKVNGIEPGKVKATPVDSVHGRYEGGYYPLSYDFDKSADAYKNAEQRNALYKQYSTAAAHTEQGQLKERVKSLDRPVRLTFDGLFNHLDDVIHDIAYRPSVIDVSRFLNQPDAKNAIVNAIGIDGYKKIGEDLKAAASTQTEFLTSADKKMRWFRFSTTLATLGYRLAVFPRRMTEDVANSMREVGFRNTLGSLGDYIMNPTETRDFVREKSPLMNERSINRERDLMDMSRQWSGRESKIKQFAFLQDTIADQAMSYPVWQSVYNASVEKHGETMAAQLADESIIKTFGSGSQIDRVGAQRGSELNRLISMYYSWHSMMFNRAWLQGKIAGLEYNEGNYGKAIATIAATTATTWIIPAATDLLWHEVLHNAPNGEETDDEKKKRRIATFAEAPFAYFPIARAAAAYTIPLALGEHPHGGYQISPAESAIESVLKTVGNGAAGMFDPDKHYDSKFMEEAARTASILLGSPQQLMTLAFNFKDYLDGEGELTWRDLVARRSKR